MVPVGRPGKEVRGPVVCNARELVEEGGGCASAPWPTCSTRDNEEALGQLWEMGSNG